MKKFLIGLILVSVLLPVFSAEAVTTPVIGTKKVAVVMVNFTTYPQQPFTISEARNMVLDIGNPNSVASYYKEVSSTQLELTGDVYGWWTLDPTNIISPSPDVCLFDFIRYLSLATGEAAISHNVDLENYDYVVILAPRVAKCLADDYGLGVRFFGGLHLFPDSNVVIGHVNAGVIAHELGHALGLAHSNNLICQEGLTVVSISSSDNCRPTIYGDPFSVMGGRVNDLFGVLNIDTRHPTAAQKNQLGWLPSSDTTVLPTSPDTTSEVTIRPLNSVLLGPKLVRTRAGKETGVNLNTYLPEVVETFYELEYRRPYGHFDNFSVFDPVVNGVTIRISPTRAFDLIDEKTYGGYGGALLIDTTPLFNLGDNTLTHNDASLGVGKTFVDRRNGVLVKTLRVGNDGATVRIEQPGVAIKVPVSGSTFQTETSTTVSVPVSISATGAFDTLSLFDGFTKLWSFRAENYSINSAPYTFNINLSAGVHNLKAVVANEMGALLAEHSMSVTVNNPATATVTTPANNAILTGTVPITVQTTGGFTKLRLQDENGSWLKVWPYNPSSNTYTLNWNTVPWPNGAHKFVAVILNDKDKELARSEAVTVTYDNLKGLRIASPEDGSGVGGVYPIQIKADGLFNAVELWVGGDRFDATNLSTKADTYTFNFNTKDPRLSNPLGNPPGTTNGPRNLQAVAYGAVAGNRVLSSPITVNIYNQEAPNTTPAPLPTPSRDTWGPGLTLTATPMPWNSKDSNTKVVLKAVANDQSGVESLSISVGSITRTCSNFLVYKTTEECSTVSLPVSQLPIGQIIKVTALDHASPANPSTGTWIVQSDSSLTGGRSISGSVSALVPAKLVINLPRGGEVWKIGETREINWSENNYRYSPGLYKIYASTQNGSWYGLINQTGERSLNWQVGKVTVNGQTQTLSPGNYWIQVIKQDGSGQAMSAGSVELTGTATAPTLSTPPTLPPNLQPPATTNPATLGTLQWTVVGTPTINLEPRTASSGGSLTASFSLRGTAVGGTVTLGQPTLSARFRHQNPLGVAISSYQPSQATFNPTTGTISAGQSVTGMATLSLAPLPTAGYFYAQIDSLTTPVNGQNQTFPLNLTSPSAHVAPLASSLNQFNWLASVWGVFADLFQLSR